MEGILMILILFTLIADLSARFEKEGSAQETVLTDHEELKLSMAAQN